MVVNRALFDRLLTRAEARQEALRGAVPECVSAQRRAFEQMLVDDGYTARCHFTLLHKTGSSAPKRKRAQMSVNSNAKRFKHAAPLLPFLSVSQEVGVDDADLSRKASDSTNCIELTHVNGFLMPCILRNSAETSAFRATCPPAQFGAPSTEQVVDAEKAVVKKPAVRPSCPSESTLEGSASEAIRSADSSDSHWIHTHRTNLDAAHESRDG